MDLDLIEDSIAEILSLTNLLIFYGDVIMNQEDVANVARIIEQKTKAIKEQLS